jgi:pyruvate dehydrogenase E2 component (dihydrolipoamide acetyltransferase)
MPKFNMSMTVGVVAKWFKKEGDLIQQGEPICEIEGDKAIMEIEAPASGVLLKIVVSEGTESPILKSIGFIGNHGDDFQPLLAEEMGTSNEEDKTDLVVPVQSNPDINKQFGKRVNASPVAKRLAQELNVDLLKVIGTGPNNLIGKNDVLEFIKNQNSIQQETPSSKKTYTLSGIKKITAERMQRSFQDAPHFSLTISVNMDKIIEMRESQKGNDHITITDILIYTIGRTLINHELLNSSINGDQINIYSNINIGFAVNTEKGLVVPVIKQADHLSLAETSSRRQELTQFAIEGKLSIDDVSDGTFTISNLGMFDIEVFSPILCPKQAAILGVGKIMTIPAFDNSDRVVKSNLMKITLVVDHRIVDGAVGSNFLKELKMNLETTKFF